MCKMYREDWTYELSLQLIDEYKKVPILWDLKHPQHSNRDKKSDAWDMIAKNMKIDVHAVKQKLGSLLGSFRREKAKGTKTIGTGKSRRIYKSRWFAFKRLHFLLNEDELRYIDTINREKNKNKSRKEQQEIDKFSSNLNSQQDLSNLDNQDTEDIDVEDIEDKPPNESTIVENMPFTAPEPKQKKMKLYDMEDDAKSEEAPEILKESPARKELPEKETLDDCAIYLQHVANKLRKYSHNTRIQVEHAINNILFAADMGKYDYPISTSFSTNYESVPLSNFTPTFHW